MQLTMILGILQNHTMRIHPETPNNTHAILHPPRSLLELGHEPDILSHAPEELPIRSCLAAVEPQQLRGRGKVLGNGFLREDMLSCEEGLADEIWL